MDAVTKRVVRRYHVRWKIALIFDGLVHRPTYHGRTHDLTLAGTGMLTHTDVFADSPVVVLLAVPALHPNRRAKVIEINARQLYSVYSGETLCFRLGLEFERFKGDGFKILSDALSHYHPIIELPSQDPFPTIFRGTTAYQKTDRTASAV